MSSRVSAKNDLIIHLTHKKTILEGKIQDLRELWHGMQTKVLEFKELHEQFDVIVNQEATPRGPGNELSWDYGSIAVQRSKSYAEIEKEAEILGEVIARLETELRVKNDELDHVRGELHELNENDQQFCNITEQIPEKSTVQNGVDSEMFVSTENETVLLNEARKISELQEKRIQEILEKNREVETAINTLQKQKDELLNVNHQWDEQYRLLKDDKERVIVELQMKLQENVGEVRLQNSNDGTLAGTVREQRRIDALVKEKDELGKQIALLREKQAKTDSLWVSAKKMITEEREARAAATRNTKVAQAKTIELEQELARGREQVAVMKQEIERLVAEGRKSPSVAVQLPQEQVEQIEMLKHQIRTYVDDFANERSDRERIQNEKERLMEELKVCENEIAFLNEQLRAYKDDFKKERTEKERIQRQIRDRRAAQAEEPWYHSPPSDYNPARRQAQYDRNYRGQAAYLPREIQEVAYQQARGKAAGGHPGGVCHGCEADGYDVIDGPSATYDCPRCARKFAIKERRAFEEHVDKCTT